MIPGRVANRRPGSMATTARMRGSTSGVASAVQAPILGIRRQVLAGVPLGRRVPDLTRERPFPGLVLRMDRSPSDRDMIPVERLVRIPAISQCRNSSITAATVRRHGFRS